MLDQSIEGKIKQLNQKANTQPTWFVGAKSSKYGEYNIKNDNPEDSMYSYNGYLFKGKYISVRDGGNILAGMNAKSHGKSFDDFQKASGALEQGGVIGVVRNRMFGSTFGSAPQYGEKTYQYLKSKYGYSLNPSSLRGSDYQQPVELWP